MCPLLALRELKERGFAVMSLVSGLVASRGTGLPEIDDIADQLNAAADAARWQYDDAPDPKPEWTIDVPGRRITYAGVDVYWGIREDLGCRQRRYSVEFDSPAGADAFANNMRRIEAFEVCLRRIAGVGRRLGIPVRLIFPYIHMGSHYFARHYVQALAATHDIALFHTANAYENYFTNFATDVATTLAVNDMTRHADLSGTYFVPRERFDAYYASLAPDERERLVEMVEAWINQNRVHRQEVVGSARLQFLQEERRRGRRVVCLIGKVLFDLEMPRGDGPAHADMREWFDHTLAIANAHPDVHLLVKPHPHEIREEIALYASEALRDWLPAELPPNVHFLGHREFNIFEIAGVLDLALLWTGTSALELGVLGVPTIVAAHYGDINYPVGHTLPQSREQYERLVTGETPLVLSPEVRLRSAALMTYLRHPDNSIPYRYTRRGLTNRSIRHLHWFEDDLRAYRENGDPHVTRIADLIEG
jgi:hypothetical protein